jgi:hypothetical protein
MRHAFTASLFRVVVLGLVLVFTLSQVVTAFAPPQQGGGLSSREIYLETCPDSISGSGDDVGVKYEQCADSAGDLMCASCLRAAAQNAFHEELDVLYECKTCPVGQSGCGKSISSDGFAEDDCFHYPNDNPVPEPDLRDCDGDGELEYYQYMECSSTDYDWTFACGACE